MTHARTRGDAGGWRRWSWCSALVATGCDTGIDGIDDDGSGPATKPVTLIVSETWVNDHQGDPGTGGAAGGSDVRARLTTLQKAIDRAARRDRHRLGRPAGRRHRLPLRAAAAGRGRALRRRSWTTYGPDLFGVDSAVLRLGEPDTVTVPGHRHDQGHPGRR